LDFRLFICGSQSQNQNEFSVRLFRDGSSSSYFSRKLLEFGAYANSLDHLDCRLAVFYNRNFILGSKFLSSSMKAVVETCSCAIALDHLDFRLIIFGSHSKKQYEFSVSFVLRQKFSFLFFNKAVRI